MLRVASVLRNLLLTLGILFGLSQGDVACASDVKKSRMEAGFNVHTDDDGIKTFNLVGKKRTEEQLLPAAPQSLPKSTANSEFARVPEVGLEEALPKTWTKQEALENLEFRFAKVNYFNLKKSDGYLHALLAQRPDLAGLPFRMGLDCRLSTDQAHSLGEALEKVRGHEKPGPGATAIDEALHKPVVASLMQIYGVKEQQADLAKLLKTIPHVEATVALARLALFSADPKARESG